MAKKLLFFLASGIFFAGCSLPAVFGQKYAALQVTSKPVAEVYLDNEKLGETPFKAQKLEVKDYDLRLQPKETQFLTWERTVSLKKNVTTAVSVDLGQNQESIAGEIISLERLTNEEAQEIATVSIPDNASVKIDGQPKGFTPLKLKDVGAGDHQISVSSPGYQQRKIDVRAVEGHRLIVDVQLAREPALSQEGMIQDSDQTKEEAQQTPKPTPTLAASSPSAVIKPPYVEILDTPTGWLRVRSSPTTYQDNEIARVDPGDTYAFIQANESGWYQIRLPDGALGWISGRYAQLHQ